MMDKYRNILINVDAAYHAADYLALNAADGTQRRRDIEYVTQHLALARGRLLTMQARESED